MILTVGNLYAQVTSATREEDEWLRGFLVYEDQGSRFRDGGRGRARPLREPLYVRGRFPAGLVPTVRVQAGRDGHTVQTVVARQPTGRRDPAADVAWLRPEQRTALDKILGAGRGVLQLGVGGGKTECVIALSRVVRARWLVLVSRDVLLTQWQARFDLRAKEAGLPERALIWQRGMGVADTWPTGEGVAVASFQALFARIKANDQTALDMLQSAEGVAIDECHEVPAGSFYNVAMRTVGAYWRVGLSATPFARGDKKSVYLLAAIGPVLFKVSAKELSEKGRVMLPTVTMHRVNHPPQPEGVRAKWSDVREQHIVRSSARNAEVVKAIVAAAKPGLVFIDALAHGVNLRALLRKAGVSSELVTGDDALTSRLAALKRLVRGDVDVIVCTWIFQAGVDVPTVSSIVVASGGKSVIGLVQKSGRAMRVEAGKVDCEVHDFDDVGIPMLERHARARLKTWLQQEYPVVRTG